MKTIEQLKADAIAALEALAIAYFDGWDIDKGAEIDALIEKIKGE